MKLSLLFNINIFPLAVAILSVVASPSRVKAAAFSGNVSGTWGTPTPGKINTEPTYTSVGTNAFTWGDPTLFENASANQLVFEGSSFSTHTSSQFKIGDLTYVNGTVLLGTSVESVPLNLSFSFDESNHNKQNFDFDYNFYLQNTPNLSEDPELNADFVFVTEQDAQRSFVYDDYKYTLSLTGFSQDNGKTSVSEFRALEGEKTKAAIFGRISKVKFSKKVPEPGFPLALSVVGVYLVSRGKAKNSK